METTVTVDQLMAVAEELASARSTYETLKATASEAESKVAAAEEKLVKLLEAAGLNKFHAAGVGTISLVTKMSVTTPKGHDDKEKFFNFLKEKYGKEGLYTYATVNHNSLNSLYNQLLEESAEPATFVIPGISAPTARTSLRLTRSK